MKIHEDKTFFSVNEKILVCLVIYNLLRFLKPSQEYHSKSNMYTYQDFLDQYKFSLDAKANENNH